MMNFPIRVQLFSNNALDGVPVSLTYSGHILNIMAVILRRTCAPTTPTIER